MARKKQKDPADIAGIVDDLLGGNSSGNGHDAEGLIDAEEAGDVDELIEQTASRRSSRARAGAVGSDPEPGREKPVRKARAPRKTAPEITEGGEQLKLPLLPLRDMVIFPHMVTSLFVGRDRSLKAIEAAMADDRVIVAVAQRNPEDEEIGPDD